MVVEGGMEGGSKVVEQAGRLISARQSWDTGHSTLTD